MSFFSSIRSLLPSIFATPPEPTGPYTPTYKDVCRTRASLKTLGLPTELVLQILDHAQYWPAYEYETHIQNPIIAKAGVHRLSAAILCFEAAIFNNSIVNEIHKNDETFKIKSIEFRVASRDQGWTSENTTGTFSTSSWTEVSILRDISGDSNRSPLLRLMNNLISSPFDFHTAMADRGWSLVKRPERALKGIQDGEGDFAWYLQGNRVATGQDDYRILWDESGCEGNEGAGSGAGFIGELRDGDRILVWARAKAS